jgi:hypothetical protein
MPRGGKREGAGRPFLLTELQRLWVGSEFEKRWRDESVTRWQAGERRGQRQLHEKWDALREVPVTLRRFVTAEGDALLNAEETLPFGDQDRVTDAQSDLAEVRNLLGQIPRISRVYIRRPQGVQIRLPAEVAKVASKRFKRLVTPRMVKTCLDEFRALERRLRADAD